MSDFFCLLFPAKCKTYASHRRSYSLAWVASRDARTHRGWRAPAPSPHTHTHTHTHTTTNTPPPTPTTHTCTPSRHTLEATDSHHLALLIKKEKLCHHDFCLTCIARHSLSHFLSHRLSIPLSFSLSPSIAVVFE